MNRQKTIARFVGRLAQFGFVVMSLTPLAASAQDRPVADAKGLQPNHDYFSQLPFEHIDTATGSLVLTFTDLVLPGPGGRDVKFQRVYNSKDDRWTFSVGYPMYIVDRPMPDRLTPMDTILMSYMPFIYGPDGSLNRTYPLDQLDTSTQGAFEFTLNYVSTNRFWRYHRGAKNLFLSDGTTCTYEDIPPAPNLAKRLKTCSGPHTPNELVIDYDTETITQTAGDVTRRVSAPGIAGGTPIAPPLPSSLSFMGRTWQFEYGATSRAVPPVGPAWEFVRAPGIEAWNFTVKTPQGGQITYAFENLPFPNLDTEDQRDSHSLALVERAVLDRGAAVAAVWTYRYNQGDIPGLSPPGVAGTVIDAPTGERIVYQHVGFEGLVGKRDVLHLQGENWVTDEHEERTYIDVPVIRHGSYVSVQTKELWTRSISRDGRDHLTVFDYDIDGLGNYHHPRRITEQSAGESGTNVRVTERQFCEYDGFTYALNVGRLKQETVKVNNGEAFVRKWEFPTIQTSDFCSQMTAQEIHGVRTEFAEYEYGVPKRVTDANGQVTRFEYSGGVQKRVQTPRHTVDREISPDGTITSETQGYGTTNARTTTFTYDHAFRLKEVKPSQAAGARSATIIEYDNVAGTWTRTTRGGSVTTTTVDGSGRPVQTTNANGVTFKTSYDANGRKVFEGYPVASGAASIGTSFDYDALGRLVKKTNPGGAFSTIAYTAGRITVTDEEGRTTVQKVEAFGTPDETRLVGLTDALSHTWTYEYDGLGNLTKVVAPDGKQRTWVYAPITARLLTETHPESGPTTYTYDAVGNLKTKSDAKNQTTLYDYDGNNRVEKITAGAEIVEITYEVGSDNRKTATVGPVSTTYLYDDAGRLAGQRAQINGQLFEIRYALDANDNVETLFYPTKRRVQYQFDSDNRVTRVSDVLSGVPYARDFTYHPSGAVTGYLAGNGIPFTFDYHGDRYWPTAIHAGPLQIAYQNYDAVGNVRAIDDARGAEWGQTLGYDSLDRLTSSTGAYGSLSYTYDEHGNMLTQGADTFAYDQLTMRLMSRGGQSFIYDNNGSVESDGQGIYAYTFRNQMKTATVAGETTTYSYDADEWRFLKTTPTGTTVYFRGPGGQLLSEITFANDGTRTSRDYIYAGSRLLAVVAQ